MSAPSPDTQQQEAHIRAMLERYAHAFMAGDGHNAAACWQAPALVVSNEGTHPVSQLAEVEEFFRIVPEQYRARGVAGTRPEIISLRGLTERLAYAEVRWPYLDPQGGEPGGGEASAYIIRIGPTGEPKICVSAVIGSKVPS